MRRFSNFESELDQRLSWRERHGWETDRRNWSDWQETEHLLSLAEQVRLAGVIAPTRNWLTASKSRLLTRFDRSRPAAADHGSGVAERSGRPPAGSPLTLPRFK